MRMLAWSVVVLVLAGSCMRTTGPNPEQQATTQNDAVSEQLATPQKQAAAEQPTTPQEQVSPEQQAAAEKLGLPTAITNSMGMTLVLIPAGEFLMGSPAAELTDRMWAKLVDMYQRPQHKVRITRPLFLGVHEVTQEQYERVMGKNLSVFEGPQHPVENVTWDEAVEFCDKLSALPEEKAAGRVYRLPTDAEWEYACRAGTTTRYSFGDDRVALEDYAWSRFSNTTPTMHPVAQKRPNAWGLYDMHGNVREWCADWYGEDYYRKSPVDDPTGPATGSVRVHRGGIWGDSASPGRSASRFSNLPEGGNRSRILGFRVAAAPSSK